MQLAQKLKTGKKNPVRKVPGGWRPIGARGRMGPVLPTQRDAEIYAESLKNPPPKNTRRLPNYGEGDLFNFHGAFREKADAIAKEQKTPGAFIKTVWYKDGPRYGVM